jgi:RNA polymerase sigma-70 factor (ECF subfamily)
MKAVVARQQRMTLTTPSDAELLRLMAAGDEAAFVGLYERHQAAIYRFALLMSGAPNIAEEVTQEVFMALIREPNRYQPTRGQLLGFLYGVARNHVLRVLQRERHYVQLPDESDEAAAYESLTSLTDPFSDCNRHEVIKLVRQAVLSLPPRYREVVVLCDFQELSCAEAAAALDCPVGTLNSRLHRAHSLLVKKLRTRSFGTAANAELKCFA